MLNVNYANHGKSLEDLINYANQQYLAKRVALVQHIPTDWTVIRRGTQIISAFLTQKSTVDYIGITSLNGETVPIAFDAKQCMRKTSFPLSNIKQHQLDYLAEWRTLGGTSFFIVEMLALRKIFRVEHNEIMSYWMDAEAGRRKSIPLEDFDNPSSGTGRWDCLRLSGGIFVSELYNENKVELIVAKEVKT